VTGNVQGAGAYVGTVGLDAPVVGWPWELVLLAFDVWNNGFTLRGTAAFDREDPFRTPGSWRITTDADTVHESRGRGGHGSDPTLWQVDFEPSLPKNATSVRIFVGAPGSDPAHPTPPPESPTVVVGLSPWPLAASLVEAVVRPAHPTPRPAGADSVRAALSGRTVRPEQVLPVSARLEDVGGSDLVILSVETWPSCFDVHVASSSRWRSGRESPFPAPQWVLAEDDRRGRYVGTYTGGHGGFS
jgi:hypothetical protein